jgi:hypothetical protein
MVVMTGLAFSSVTSTGASAAGADADLALVGVPADISTVPTSPAGAVVNYTLPTAMDEDSPATASVSCDPPPGSTFPIAVGTVVTCTATDPDDTNSPVSATFSVFVPFPVYQALTPARITDTRPGSGYPNAGHTLGPGATLNVQVVGAGGVPASGTGFDWNGPPTAVVLNVTATDATQASYLTVWPTGAARPVASNVNFVAGQTVPNLVEVGLGSAGQVSIYNPLGSVDAVVDVEGYVQDTFIPPRFGTPGLYNALSPARITDTRPGSGYPNAGHTLGPGGTLNVQVMGVGGVPNDPVFNPVGAVVLNVTVTAPTRASYLTVWPAGTARPVASNLDFVAGQTVANRVIVPVGSSGQVSIYNHAGSADVVVDVAGWFTGVSESPGGAGAGFYSLAPARITDTRPGSGLPNAGYTLGPGAILAVQVAGVGGVPPGGALAAVLNVTATSTTKASNLTVWPNGAARPSTSDLNWVAGRTVPNLVIAPLGASGQILLYNNAGSVNVVVDVLGYYG